MTRTTREKLPRTVRNIERRPAKRTWILLAQRTKAKLVEHGGAGEELTLLEGFVNPEGDRQTRELVSDRPGRVHRKSVGGGRHPAAVSEDAHERALTEFADDLAKTIERGLAQGRCDRIILAAEPHCLGKIRKSLNPKARGRVSATFHQDLFRLNSRSLYSKLEEFLR